ncbi:MAG: hypothetical protein V1774_06995, partial [Candidatus Eisenbacteria bacterium]
MKHSPRNARNETERTPALGTAKEYSRAFHGGQEESPSLGEGLIALYQQGERWQTIEAALRLLTSPRGLGFKRAFLFLLDGAGTTLTGVAAAKRPRAVAEGLPATAGDCSSCTDERLTALVREIGLPTGAAKENLLLKAMAEGEVHRLSQEELQAALGPAFECCAGSRAVWIVPVPDGHPLGVLLLEEPGRASRRHAQRARLASVVAAHLGKALVQKEAESAHLESAAKGRALNEAVRDILGATNLPDVLERAMHAGLKASGAGCALLWTFDEQTRELEAVVHLPAERERSLEEWQEALNRLAWTRVTAGGICL